MTKIPNNSPVFLFVLLHRSGPFRENHICIRGLEAARHGDVVELDLLQSVVLEDASFFGDDEIVHFEGAKVIRVARHAHVKRVVAFPIKVIRARTSLVGSESFA